MEENEMTKKEAIEIIRAARCTSPLRDALETLIPELAESEDERIRKWIVNLLHELHYNQTAHPMALKAIDWLEKQKEHQNNSDAPKEKSVGGDFLSSHKDKNLDEIAQDYVDDVKQYHQEPTWDLMQTAVCYGANWQKEQFEKNRLANCDALSKEDCDRETDFAMEIIEKEHRQPTFNDAINYGMRLQKEQKPAEWSEEDEDRIRQIERIAQQAGCTQKLQEEIHDWLKSLRPQPKVELSEDVKKILDEVSHILIGLNYKQVAKAYKQAIEKLLYSRPSWKPSEEQIYSLGTVVKGYDECTVGSVGYHLKEMYEQLKKLM